MKTFILGLNLIKKQKNSYPSHASSMCRIIKTKLKLSVYNNIIFWVGAHPPYAKILVVSYKQITTPIRMNNKNNERSVYLQPTTQTLKNQNFT